MKSGSRSEGFGCFCVEANMQEACKACDTAQVRKVCALMNLPREREEELLARAKLLIGEAEEHACNPEVMGRIYGMLTQELGQDDPYRALRTFCNAEVLRLAPQLRAQIAEAPDPLSVALRLAISGNLIDFAARHTFSLQMLRERLKTVETLAIDDSALLFEALADAKRLLYLGDNCGEIVLDKLFIESLKERFPRLHAAFGVRGRPIVNDVTLMDASQVQMEDAAEVLSNGDGALGTVLGHTSSAFRRAFEAADVVICKGQGNYESLMNCGKPNLFFLFMAKCEVVAAPLGVPVLSIVCLRANDVRDG